MNQTFIILLLAIVVALSSGVEIKDEGSFSTGTDYQKEKERTGQEPPEYKRVYHRVIPGGSEHAEVVASNSPGSNSWSQSYSKHQSFGSADSSSFSSYKSTNASATDKPLSQDEGQDAMARHNEAMQDAQRFHQQSMMGMGMGMGGMGMGGMGQPSFGAAPKYTTNGNDGFNNWMNDYMDAMKQMMKVQNEQIEAIRRLIMAQQQLGYYNNPRYQEPSVTKVSVSDSRQN